MRKLLFSLLTLLAFALPSYGQQGVHSHRFTIAGPNAAINLINTGIAWHKLTWNVSGTASVCTVALDTSANGTTWSAGGAITGQTCTSNGSSSVVNVVANYVRINMTALTVTAGSSVTVTWSGWTSNPGGGGGTVPFGSVTSGTNSQTLQVAGNLLPTGAGSIVATDVVGLDNLTDGFLPKATSAASTLDDSHCDEGITTANTLTCTNTSGAKFAAVATGTSPPTCTPGTSGVDCLAEGTAPTGAAGIDMLYANATNHCLTALNNNVDLGCLQAAVSSSCGTTSSCANTSLPKLRIVVGSAPLVTGTPSAVTITGISPAFTSTSSYFCTLAAQSAATTALLSVANVSSSSFTITGPAAVTTVINYTCVGN